jgi:hypothetical protein
VVAVAAEGIGDEKLVFLAGGRLVALRLFVVPPHKSAEPAVGDVAEVVRNLDIVVLVQRHLAEALACVGGRVDVVACWVHRAGCRWLD